jgi:mono/diheme cytochrome c family protein
MPNLRAVVKHKGGNLMGHFSKFLGISAALMMLSVVVVGAEERDPLKPRVPADQMSDARANKNPVDATPENIAKGKALFEGKGTCFNCHGKNGDGQGEAGKILNPSPRINGASSTKAERRRALLGDQERKCRHRHGPLDPGRNH